MPSLPRMAAPRADRKPLWNGKWALQGSNLRPTDYESAALTG